jgi:hypothetical protein
MNLNSVRLRTDWAVPVSQPSHSDRAASQPAHCDRLLRSFRSLAMEGLVQVTIFGKHLVIRDLQKAKKKLHGYL